ncbi:hypothetical protein MMC27_006763 [Xylographa pallens]|nr:hypothetical protein [Xylographa pallens]
MSRVPDRPRGLADTYTPRDQVITDYVIPPRDFLPLKDLTVSAFYNRFCNSNPEARKLKPWDVILAAYRDYVCKYYGNDLDHVWANYKATNLDIPHNIRWKHCVALEDELKQAKFSSCSASKRSRLSYDGNVSDTIPKRVKAEPASHSSEIWGISSTIGGNRKTPSPLSVSEEASLPKVPSQLYSPSTPHLRVDWINEQRQTEDDRRVVLPFDIAVKGTAGKSQATKGSSPPISRRSTELTGHVRQASPITVRTTVSGSDVSDNRVFQSPISSIEAVAAPEQPENHEQREHASCSDVLVRKAVGGSRSGHDLLQSLLLRENGSAVVEQSRIAETKHAAFLLKKISTDSKSTSRKPSSAAGKPGTLPPVPEPAAFCSALHFVSEPMTASSIPTVLFGTSSTPAKRTSLQAPTDTIRSPLATVQENLRNLPKSVTKHVVRLEAFLKGAAKELEAGDEAITPQSIRSEALLRSASTELKALRSAMDVQPTAVDPKAGSQKSVTTRIIRLAAFLNEAVVEQGLNNDKEITSQSIGLEALLGSAVSELGVLKSALAA